MRKGQSCRPEPLISRHTIVNCQCYLSQLHGAAATISSICTTANTIGRSPYGGCGQACDRPACGIKHAPLARGGRCAAAPPPQSSLHPVPACLQRELSSIWMSCTAVFALGLVAGHKGKQGKSLAGSCLVEPWQVMTKSQSWLLRPRAAPPALATVHPSPSAVRSAACTAASISSMVSSAISSPSSSCLHRIELGQWALHLQRHHRSCTRGYERLE